MNKSNFLFVLTPIKAISKYMCRFDLRNKEGNKSHLGLARMLLLFLVKKRLLIPQNFL